MAEDSLVLKLWELKRVDFSSPDEIPKMMVAATTEKSAREYGNQAAKSEGYVWTDYSRADARLLGNAAEGIEPGVLFP